MRILNAEQIRRLAPVAHVVECLQAAFRNPGAALPRQVLNVPGGTGGRLFLGMPAFDEQGGVVKVVTLFPDNESKGLPTIQAEIVVFSGSGTPVAVLDGTAITHLRTGAASALASTYLSRADSAHLVIIGAGALAPAMAEAHCAVRPITRVSICGRSAGRAAATAAMVRSRVGAEVEVIVSGSAEQAVMTADIVSCATSSATPVLSGKWLRPGMFVDLVGSFSPHKREVDDDAVRNARIFVDTFEGALSEAGDILDPMARGVIERARIEGELADLASGRVAGRRSDEEIILFKSVGTSLEDLAASRLVLAAASREPG
jgi:ornithine cyclodeaminase/alanine dehydrogenase-like protein (mu-crystallin family)